MDRTLNGVRKRYRRGPLVLDGVDLDIAAGDTVAVVGPNGAGKSSLLRIVAGLTRPSEGTVTGSPAVGYVPGRFPGGQRLGALAYLVHMGRISGLSSREARRRGIAWLDRLALSGGRDTSLRELSKGNAQKVGLAQALLAEPELVVLDEPFSGLDEAAHATLAEIMSETSRRGAGVVFTEHRTDRARGHATRVFRLAGGKLHPTGPGDDAEPPARIVLSGAEPGAWRSEPGVLTVDVDGEHLELTVPGSRCDELLLAALRRGCSVRHVERRTP